MKTFKFTGFANFSDTFGWDNGLSSSIEKETTFNEALEEEIKAVEYSSTFNQSCLPETQLKGVYEIFNNEHGGTRNTWGFVIAKDEDEANKLLLQYEDSFGVVEYVQD